MLTFRIFISSTFMDFEQERIALQDRVFPNLRKWCEEQNVRCEVIDLRWGVPESTQHVHGTLDLCLDEVRRCQKVTPKPNFIVLLGDRYGWRPLPVLLYPDEWKLIRDHAGPAGSLLDIWYNEDASILHKPGGPPASVHALQPWYPAIEVGQDNERSEGAWRKAEGELRRVLDEVVRAHPDKFDRLGRSATHMEIDLGALDEQCGPALVFRRTLIGLPDGSPYADAPQATQELGNLWNKLKKKLAGSTKDILERSVGVVELESPSAPYLDDFAKWAYDRLLWHIEDQIKINKARAETAPGEAENMAHRGFGEVRSRVFVGREVELEEILAYLRPDVSSSSQDPLLLVAPAGAGKTALLAQVASRCRESSTITVIERYIGATPNSFSSAALIADVKASLIAASPGAAAVLVDGLDLTDGTLGRRLIALAAEHGAVLCATMRREKKDLSGELRGQWRIHELVSSAKATPSDAVLDAWMADASPARRLIGDRRKEVLAALGSEALPLATRIAAGLSARADYIPPAARPASLADWVAVALEDVGHAVMPELARCTVECLAASRFGLSIDELAGLLWQDGAVRAEFEATRQWDWPHDSLPPILISRILGRLEHLTALAEVDGAVTIRFLHREFEKAALARSRTADGGQGRYGAVGRFFAREIPPDAWSRATPSVRRALLEAPRALILAGNEMQALEVIADFPFLQAKVDAGLLDDLLVDLEHLARRWPASEDLYRWLGSIAHQLRNPASEVSVGHLLLQQMANALPGSSAAAIARRWLRRGGRFERWLQGTAQSGGTEFAASDHCIERAVILGVRLGTFAEHNGQDHRDLIIWQADTGQLLARLRHPIPDPAMRLPLQASVAGIGRFWTWHAAYEVDISTYELRRHKTFYTDRVLIGPLTLAWRCGMIWLWQERADAPRLDSLRAPDLFCAIPLPDGRLLACTRFGALEVFGVDGEQIRRDPISNVPDTCGRHRWTAASLDFDLLRTVGGGLLRVTSSSWSGEVELIVPAASEVLTTSGVLTACGGPSGPLAAHPGFRVTDNDDNSEYFVNWRPPIPGCAPDRRPMCFYSSVDGTLLRELDLPFRPLGIFAGPGQDFLAWGDIVDPNPDEFSSKLVVVRYASLEAEAEEVHSDFFYNSFAMVVDGIGLLLIDKPGLVTLFYPHRAEPLRFTAYKDNRAAVVGKGFATWQIQNPRRELSSLEWSWVHLWSLDGVSLGAVYAGGQPVDVIADGMDAIVVRSDGTAGRLRLDTAGSDAFLFAQVAWLGSGRTNSGWHGRERLLVADSDGRKATLDLRRRCFKRLPDGEDDACRRGEWMQSMRGGWVAVYPNEYLNNDSKYCRIVVHKEDGTQNYICPFASNFEYDMFELSPSLVRVSQNRFLFLSHDPEYRKPELRDQTWAIPYNSRLLPSGAIMLSDDDVSTFVDAYDGPQVDAAGPGNEEAEMAAPSSTEANARAIPYDSRLLPSGAVMLPGDNVPIFVDAYAGLPVDAAGAGNEEAGVAAPSSTETNTHQCNGLRVTRLTSTHIRLDAPALDRAALNWYAPARVVLAEARPDGAIVILATGEAVHLVPYCGADIDRELLREAATHASPGDTRQKADALPSDEELFQQAVVLHDATVARCGRADPESLCAALLNRWQLELVRPGGAPSSVTAFTLAERLPEGGLNYDAPPEALLVWAEALCDSAPQLSSRVADWALTALFDSWKAKIYGLSLLERLIDLLKKLEVDPAPAQALLVEIKREQDLAASKPRLYRYRRGGGGDLSVKPIALHLP